MLIIFLKKHTEQNKKKEISQICQSTVFAGTDIDISSGTGTL